MEKRPPEEKAQVYLQYQRTVLAQAGIRVTEPQLSGIMKTLGELSRHYTFVLFDDVAPALKALKARGLTLGLISNIAQEMDFLLDKLGLSWYLDFVVTSAKAKADKPDPRIFTFALEQAKANATEALHVGDQYLIDVAGAREAGLKALLLDRYDLFPEVKDCPRIRSLTEVADHLS